MRLTGVVWCAALLAVALAVDQTGEPQPAAVPVQPQDGTAKIAAGAKPENDEPFENFNFDAVVEKEEKDAEATVEEPKNVDEKGEPTTPPSTSAATEAAATEAVTETVTEGAKTEAPAEAVFEETTEVTEKETATEAPSTAAPKPEEVKEEVMEKVEAPVAAAAAAPASVDAPKSIVAPPPAPPQPSEPALPEHSETEHPLPEPAIKFDNIKMDEDYGDVVESAKPDEVDNEVISQLVDRFLNTGSIQNNDGKVHYANPAAQALVNSSAYWNTDKLEAAGSIKDEAKIKEWLAGYNKEAMKILQEVTKASWIYVTDASPTVKRALDEAEEVASRFVRATAQQAKQFDASSSQDESLQKQLAYVSFEGMNALDAEKLQEYNKHLHVINREISESAVCDADTPPPCALKKVDVGSIFLIERDSARLAKLWNNLARAVNKLKPHYKAVSTMNNEGAKVNGFPSGGAMWRSPFELSSKNTPAKVDLEKQLEKVNKDLMPFYQQLHAYMRRQIAGIFSNPAGLGKDAPIPAHLFGSLEGGDWSQHYQPTRPYPESDDSSEEILTALTAQNATTKTMFIKAYRYFKSVGFPPLPKTFWTNSVFSRVWTKDMICNPAAAIDMRDGADFRVKVCAQMGDIDLKLAHQLLAQTYYQYLFRQQPLLFREAPTPLSESIANVFAHLSTNPHYLYSQELIPVSLLEPKESTIVNRLYKEALENIPKIQFAQAADKWRFALMDGKIMDKNMNDEWWKIRSEFEGVRAPQPYNASNLDALIHTTISQDHSPALRNIISYVAQFQILKAVCPEETPLAEGCILSEDTTERLRETMKKGSSISWVDALKMITGKGELDAQPLLEYYQPLISWLQNTNEIDQVIIGWDGEGTPFTAEEIPQPRADGDSGTGIISEDRIAYPGHDCTNGQECLLDSHCDGKKCVCNEGLYSLIIGDTVNCVPGNPADSGFGNGGGGLVIGLYESETTTTAVPKSTTSKPAMRTVSSSASVGLLAALAALLACLL